MELINRLLGLLLGLALLACGLLLIIETLLALAGASGWLIDREGATQAIRPLRWAAPDVVVVAALVGVVALALALLQVWPSRPRFLPVEPHGPDRRDAVDGRGLQGLLQRVASEDEDVLSASVAVRRRKAKVNVSVPSDADRKAVQSRVEERVRMQLDSLSLERSLKPAVKPERSKERVR